MSAGARNSRQVAGSKGAHTRPAMSIVPKPQHRLLEHIRQSLCQRMPAVICTTGLGLIRPVGRCVKSVHSIHGCHPTVMSFLQRQGADEAPKRDIMIGYSLFENKNRPVVQLDRAQPPHDGLQL